MIQKVLFLLLVIIMGSSVSGQDIPHANHSNPLPQLTDTTTHFTDTACFILPVRPKQQMPPDSLTKPYLERIATFKALLEQTANILPLKSEITVNTNPTLPDSLTITDSIECTPQPLWYNVPNLPKLTADSINITFALQPLRAKPKDNTYLFYIFFVLAAIYTYLSYNYTGYVEKLRESVFNVYIARQFYEDFNHANFIINLIMWLLTAGSMGLFAFLSIRFFGKLPQVQDWILLPATLSTVGILIMFRRVVIQITGTILPVAAVAQFYLFNNRIISLYFAVLMLPILLLLSFGSYTPALWAFNLCLATLCIMCIFILYRGFTIVKEMWIHYKFHFFLYLCTLEIVPLLVLGKSAIKYLW
ncbi:MAG TPA: DUF4271 domain-containing protein [Chitinophagales bacterium]|nr:DUF4271 domain-containing protein [Chitinophagales bacterium]HRK25757.1 DUF4271 domain-containing protein [Chitinophagales bacterium]